MTPHLNIQSFTGAHMGSFHFHCYLCHVGSYHCPYFCAGLIYLGYAVGNIQLGNSNTQSPTVHAIHFFHRPGLKDLNKPLHLLLLQAPFLSPPGTSRMSLLCYLSLLVCSIHKTSLISWIYWSSLEDFCSSYLSLDMLQYSSIGLFSTLS